MAELTVAMTYGTALYGAAKDVNKVEEIAEELQVLETAFKDEPEIFTFLATPSIPASEKKKVIHSAFDGQMCEEMLNFLFVLIDKGRVPAFTQIARAFRELQNQDEGFSYGRMVSARPLTEEQVSRFEKEVGDLLKARVKLEVEINPALIGGVSIFIDGKVIDASVRSRLQSIADSLM